LSAAIPRNPVLEQLQWLTPAPLWNTTSVGAASSGLTQPWIAELRSDTFVQDFLGLLSGSNGATPDGLASTVPHLTVDGTDTGAFRLFQPLSQCYYLVTASLVCRRPGIPDRAVAAAAGEKTSFVIRLIGDDGGEQAWVPAGQGSTSAPAPGAPPSGTWKSATADQLVPGEEKLPMHAAPVAGFAEDGTTAATLGMAAGAQSSRTVFYGYVPVGRRERMVTAMPDPVTTLANLKQENPFLDELIGRVIDPWHKITNFSMPSPATSFPPPTSFPNYPSTYVLLDLADWLSKYVPAVYDAITTGSTVTGAENALLTVLQQTTVAVTSAQKVVSAQNVASVIASLVPYLPLVTGHDITGPPSTYDLRKPIDTTTNAQRPDNWFDPPKQTAAVSLADFARDALAQAGTPAPPATQDPSYQPGVPPELQGMIKNDPVTPPAGTSEQTYVIRTVFEHEPCRPVLSAPSRQFVLARAIDPDAPARKIRIQMPDITNMRRFQRGVAIEIPPSLRAITDHLTPPTDVLKGAKIDTNGGVQVGMICSFSLQIIFVCAFMVLFVFLLLFNIVFWWMAYLKICFPIPVLRSKPNAPSP
jgi:hypothetical protein